MDAGQCDLNVRRGAVFRRRWTFSVNGTPVTPTAAEAANAAGLTLPLTIDGDAVVLDYSAADTLALSVGSWPWDMYVTLNGDRGRVLQGTMVVVAGVAEGVGQ